jgi:signal transduction histidine kinase
VHVTVTDEGPCIAVADLPFIFDRFWTNRAGGNKSTGLGLPITRQIGDAYGGRLWAESDLGRGTTIHFTSPSRPPTRWPWRPPTSAPDHDRGCGA